MGKSLKTVKKMNNKLKFLLWFREKSQIKDAPRVGRKFVTLVFKIRLNKRLSSISHITVNFSVSL